MQLYALYLFGSSDLISITISITTDPSAKEVKLHLSSVHFTWPTLHVGPRDDIDEPFEKESDIIEKKRYTFGTMSSTPSPRGAQEQTLGADPDPGSGQVNYGPVPVHGIGPSWSPAELPGVRRPSSILSPYGQSPSPSLSNQDMVLVSNNSISQHSSEIGSSAYAVTR